MWYTALQYHLWNVLFYLWQYVVDRVMFVNAIITRRANRVDEYVNR